MVQIEKITFKIKDASDLEVLKYLATLNYQRYNFAMAANKLVTKIVFFLIFRNVRKNIEKFNILKTNPIQICYDIYKKVLKEKDFLVLHYTGISVLYQDSTLWEIHRFYKLKKFKNFIASSPEFEFTFSVNLLLTICYYVLNETNYCSKLFKEIKQKEE